MTINELKAVLQSRYDRTRWIALLRSVLPMTEGFAKPRELDFTDQSVVSAFQLGRIPLDGGRTVAIIEVRVSGQIDLQRNRVGLRNTVARFIGQEGADGVLAFFIGDSADYRFSFAARTNAFTDDGQLEQNETAPRRYTYLLGPNQPCRTAVERLELLRVAGGRAKLTDLIEAFKVEALFKEFYTDYRKVFAKVEESIKPSLAAPETLRLFTQRLFNRIMFLAFVERKGWLKFGNRTDYLAALWDDYLSSRRTAGDANSTNFYRERLCPLFFEGLNQSSRPARTSDPRFGSVPYLNGGLFERADDGTDVHAAVSVPDSAIAAILDSESGLFSRYNFTVAESTPLEIQVAVDPEMLGKVFEELVTGRHEQGSYYTPKPIVSYMGRAVLVEYLVDACHLEERATIERFVHDHDLTGLGDVARVSSALSSVRICDPACGSGAYLLGMLHELLELRLLLLGRDAASDGSYQLRLDIIERNLYGVDLDSFAVNIARLRLWLSLAVEYAGSEPPPLPNLDFKIERGDSLAAPAPQDVFQRDAVQEFRDKKSAFLRAHGEEKLLLRREVDRIRSDLTVWQEADLAAHGFNWAVEFAEVFLPETSAATLTGELNIGQELAPSSVPGGFDIIVANPPYVRMELIKSQKPILKRRFPDVHSERADLYIYFFARAHELLRPGGVAAFITPNKWLKAGYGESLRRRLLDEQETVLVADFGDLDVFEGVALLCAITVWRKTPRGHRPTDWVAVKDLDECYNSGIRSYFAANAISVSSDKFGAGKPRLSTNEGADIRQKMEKSGPRLGELLEGKICRGVVTGLNEAFVINRETYQRFIQASPSSSEIIKPLLAGDDIRRYEVHSRDAYLIYAYHGLDISSFPEISEHLESYRSYPGSDGKMMGLDHRATEQEWFELQQPQMAYRKYFDGAKIVYPEIGKEARFVLETEGKYLNNKCFFLPLSDWYLLGVLNSSTSTLALREICSPLLGGVVEFRAQYLETLPIPDASSADRESVGRLAQEVQSLHFRRRELCERFMAQLGLPRAVSTSRNPLEQPWALEATEYAKRVRKLTGHAPDMSIYLTNREQAQVLTGQIQALEAEIDARVAVLYGLS